MLSCFQNKLFSSAVFESLPEAEIIDIDSCADAVVKDIKSFLRALTADKIVSIEHRKQEVVGCQFLFFRLETVTQLAAVKIRALSQGVEDIASIVVKCLFMQSNNGQGRFFVIFFQHIIAVKYVLGLITEYPRI